MNAADWFRRLPWPIVLSVVLLECLGCLAIARYTELTDGNQRFLRQQMVWVLLSLAAMLGASLPNYVRLRRWSYPLYFLALAALAAVYFFPAINGAHRWIRLGPVGIQPSELAKPALVLALARWFMYRENHRRLRGLLVPLALTVAPVLLILKEPDLGTAALLPPVVLVMLLAAGARRADLVRLGLAALLLMPVLWTQMSREQKSRITTMFEQPSPQRRPSDDAYQLQQGKQMLALGGGWGSLFRGRASEDPTVYHLPAARSDFIFCVLGERLGLPGMAMVLGLYGVLVWQGIAAALATREPFGRLLAAGLTALVAVEVLVNTLMNVGLAPITGVSLPLVSYGGSGLLAHGLALGLVANVALRPGYEMAGEPFRWKAGEG